MKHEELREALKRGREASDARVEESLYRNALAGNTTAQIFWLKNRRPDRWRDVQNIEAATAHYIISDRPLTEQEWIDQRTKLIDANVVPELSKPTGVEDRPSDTNGLDE